MKKDRNSAIELLRIFAMLLIILHHISYHGEMYTKTTGINQMISCFMVSGGKIGAQLFFMISGYYLIDKYEYPTKTLVKTISTVYFYVITLFLVANLTHYVEFKGFYQILNVIFPVNSKRYWFISAYVFSLMLAPVLMELIRKVSFKANLSVLVIFGLFITLLPLILKRDPSLDGNVLSALYYFYIGAYLKLYPPTMKPWTYFILGLLAYSAIASGTYINLQIGFAETKDFLYRMSSPLSLLCSIWIFCFFIVLKPFNNRIINELGASTFGVYLLHDSQYRSFIWKKLLHVSSYYTSNKLILHYPVWMLEVFIVCVIIDRIRYYLVQRPFENSVLFENICNKINNIPIISDINELYSKKEDILEDNTLKEFYD